MSFPQNEIPEFVAELIECFQPGVDSLEDPEFLPLSRWLAQSERHRQMFDDLCQFDRQIANAYRNVPIDPELAVRLKNAIASPPDRASGGEPLNPSTTRQVSPASQPSDETTTSPADARRSRDSRLRQVAAVAAVVLVLCIGWIAYTSWPVFHQVPNDAALARQAIDWARMVTNMNTWNNEIHDLPIRQNLLVGLRAAPQRWLTFETPSFGKTVVIEIKSSGRHRAHLFVIDRAERATGNADENANRPLLFPRTPSFQTAGFTIGITKFGGVQYLLVVQGNQQDYLQLIDKRPTG